MDSNNPECSSAERWKVQHYVPTDRRMPSSSITRRSRDTHCPICPARRHSSSSDTAPEAPPQFVRIGQVSLPTLSRNWVELACTSKNANPPHVVHYDEPPAACPPGFEPTTDDVGDKECSSDKGGGLGLFIKGRSGAWLQNSDNTAETTPRRQTVPPPCPRPVRGMTFPHQPGDDCRQVTVPPPPGGVGGGGHHRRPDCAEFMAGPLLAVGCQRL